MPLSGFLPAYACLALDKNNYFNTSRRSTDACLVHFLCKTGLIMYMNHGHLHKSIVFTFSKHRNLSRTLIV